MLFEDSIFYKENKDNMEKKYLMSISISSIINIFLEFICV